MGDQSGAGGKAGVPEKRQEDGEVQRRKGRTKKGRREANRQTTPALCAICDRGSSLQCRKQ